MNDQQNNTTGKATGTQTEDEAVQRGKAAIEAEKVATGVDKDPAAANQEEQKDADQWRNEG